jgi:RNA polymerase sigma factor (sigma-70 family)
LALPAELERLLSAGPESATADEAWRGFLVRYSPLLLKTARSLGGSRDAVMDRYAYVIERLRDEDCRRLRAFQDNGRATFVTWLVVTARRLCLDEYRQRYGRSGRNRDDDAGRRRSARRALADLTGSDTDVGDIADAVNDPARLAELESQHSRLESVLSALPYSDRMLLTLRFEDDLAAREIAEIMGLASPFQVYRRLDRILASLRSLLRRDAFDAG